MNETYNALFKNGILKLEHKHLEIKGLKHALNFPKVFKDKWIQIVLNQVHVNSMWLEGPVKITKDAMHMVSGYLIGEKTKIV